MLAHFDTSNHELYMRAALYEAEQAAQRGDKPIGAVIVHRGQILARSANQLHTLQSHVAHAENTAIFACAKFLFHYEWECVLYTKPCVMCIGTIVMANIRHVVFGVTDHYMETTTYINRHPYLHERIHHYVSRVLRMECTQLL
jgi:tRNA(adenine34) deaminase